MSKVFVCFLGTGKYVPVYYCLNDIKAEFSKYVQVAILDILTKEGNKPDKIVVFLTHGARKIHWEGANGLHKSIKSLGFNDDQIYEVPIPDGKSTEEINKIFMEIFNSLKKQDQVYFDITHSFRSLPMLSLVALVYAQILKQIEIKKIYYGAFEVLGRPEEVEKMTERKRNCPIFDLTHYVYLLNWSFAVEEFVKYGISHRLFDFSKKRLKPILKQAKGQDKTASDLNKFLKIIYNLTQYLATCRGKKILDLDISEFFSKDFSDVVPELTPLLDITINKIKGFDSKNDWHKGMTAVDWCIEHKLIQQGYTSLQEVIKYEISKYINIPEKDIENKTNFVSSFFNAVYQKDEDQWTGELKKHKEYAKILKQKLGKTGEDFSKIFNELTKFRNDINHFGLKQHSTKYEKLQDKLSFFKQEIEDKIWDVIEKIKN